MGMAMEVMHTEKDTVLTAPEEALMGSQAVMAMVMEQPVGTGMEMLTDMAVEMDTEAVTDMEEGMVMGTPMRVGTAPAPVIITHT